MGKATNPRKRGEPSAPRVIKSAAEEPRVVNTASREDREAERKLLAELRAKDDIRVVSDGDRVIAAERVDVFRLLLNRKALTATQYEAARRLERDIAAAEGVDRPERPLVRVDGDEGRGGPMDRRLAARAEVEAVLALVGMINRKLLEALLGPQFRGRHVLWRTVVWKVTGEARDEVQAGAVRSACAHLVEGYTELDYRKPQRVVVARAC